MRCFVAIELPENVRHLLAGIQDRLRPRLQGVRWTRPEQVHLTLRFLGEVSDADVEDVCRAVGRAAAAGSAFKLALAGTGFFPPHGPARIIWAGIKAPCADLLHCQKACERELARCGFPPESRPFSPHLTIGRVARPSLRQDVSAALAGLPPLESPAFTVDHLVLFESLLRPAGPIYTPLGQFPLSGIG